MSSLASSPGALRSAPESVRRVSGRRRASAVVFAVLCSLSFVLVVVPLVDILWTVLSRGASALNLQVFTQVTNGISGGLLNAIEGTVVLSAGAIVFAAPVGVLTGVYLAEYGSGPWGSSVRFLADVLTGVPSIVLGYFSYVTLVEGLGWQFSALAAAMPRWHWVADGVHLELSLQDLVILGGSTARRAKEVSPKDLYYARVRIRDENAYYDIARWPPEAARQDLERLRRHSIPEALESRKRAELDARQRGFHILTSYQTPLPPARP